jgi:hypothetical protein
VLINAGSILRHSGRYQEGCDECYCEDEFYGHDSSPAFDEEAMMCALNSKFGAGYWPAKDQGDILRRSRQLGDTAWSPNDDMTLTKSLPMR